MVTLDAAALLDPAVIEDPYPFYARLREEAPVAAMSGVSVYVASTWEVVTDAVGRVEDFSSHLERLVVTGDDGRPELFDMGDRGSAITTLATADPPVHTMHRKVVFPELVERRMTAMEAEVRALAEPLVDAAIADRRVELTGAVSNPLPMRVVSRVIGLPDDDADQLLEWAFRGTELLAGTTPLARMATLGASADAAATYLAARLVEATADPPETLLGTIGAAVNTGAISMAEAVATLVILLGAGGESTTSMVGNSVRTLAEDHALQEELRADPALIPAFVEEVARLESPFRFHYRQVARDSELGGVQIPYGATLLLMWASANRDPKEFDRPDDVVLDRAVPRHHLAFGRGIHYCVGAPLARLEARVVLEQLLEHTRSFTLDPARAPAYAPSFFVRRHAHLDLVIDAR